MAGVEPATDEWVIVFSHTALPLSYTNTTEDCDLTSPPSH